MSLAAVDAERRATVVLDEIETARRKWHGEQRRPRALSAREALEVMSFECLLVWAYGKRLLAGEEPSPEDEARVTTALRTIDTLVDEAIG